MVFEYWSFGNSAALLQLLNGVAAIMSPSGGIMGAVRSAALIAFLVIVIGAALRNDPSPMVNWMIGLAIAWGIMFVPKVTMVVNDRTPNGSISTYTVSNIPLGLGFVASASSKLNFWLTRQAETAFTLPSYAQFTNVGLMAPQKLLLSMDNMYMRNATLEQDWQQFFNECTWYDMNVYSKRLGLAGFVSHESISKATDPLTELGKTNNVLFVTTSTGGRATRTCKDAYDILKQSTESMANSTAVQQQYAQLAFPGVDPAEALDAYRNSIQYSNQLLTSSSKDISDTLMNRWMINLLKNRELRTAVNSGNTALAMTELAAVQAEQQRMNAYLQSARAAQDTIPAIRNILEAVAIGLFPPLLILMVLAGMMGLKLMLEWAMFFLSLQLWGFCYAIMNMVMINKTANNVYANTLSADIPFYALNNVSSISEEAAADLAMAGSIAWAIPIICYGLTRGVGAAMGSLASSMAGPAKSSAEATGASAGVGNTRQGELRMNQASIGNTAQIGGAGGTSTMFMGDTGFRAQSPRLAAFSGFSSSAAGVSANLGQAVGQAAQVQAGLAKDAARESSVAASKEQTAALAETISSATKRSDTASVGKGWDSSTNGSYETGSSGLQSLMSQVKKSTGASDSEAASIVAGAKVNAGPSIAGFGAQLTSSIDKQYGSKAAREFSSAQGADTSNSIADAHRMVSALSSSSQAREAVTGGTEQSKATEGRFQRADSLRSQAQAKLSESQKWSDVASRSASNSAQVGQDLLASDPAAASRIAAVAASPEYQSRKAAGDHIGAGQMLDRALQAEGLTPDKMLQQISSQPSVSTEPLTTSSGQTVDSGSASSQFASDSNQVNQSGQAGVSSTRSQAPKVNTSRPNTSRMASSVNDGLGAVGGTIEASEKALRQESATQQSDVASKVPQSKSDGSFAAREGQTSGALGRAADGAKDTASRAGAGTIDNLPKPILTDFINKK